MEHGEQGHLHSSGAPAASQKPVLTFDQIQNVQQLKAGRYSVVLKGDCPQLHPAKSVAIKVYEKPSLTPKKQKMATREAIVLKYLNSQGVPNITHMWSAYASQDRFHLIMEYCSGGNLLDFLKAQQPHAVSEQWLAKAIAAPLLRTLAAMHAVGVTHRDVKLENIFLDDSGAVKLGDFDLAVFHHEAQARAPVGTIFYMAPEVLLLASYKGSALEAAVSKRVGEKMDVWSLGVCLFELAAGYKPFQGVSYEGIAAAVIQHAMADLPPHLSPAFKSFMASALTYDPQQRPSAMQLLDHPWVQVHMPTAVRSDSAGSLLDAVDVKGMTKPYTLQHLAQQQQQHGQHSTSPASASSARQNSLSHACSAASLLLRQQQGAQHAGGSSTASGHTSAGSTDGAASLTGSSCSSTALKYSKEQLYCGAGGSPCGGAAAAATISVAAMAGPGIESCGVIPAGGDRLFDRNMGPFASSSAAAAVAGATGGSASAVGMQMYCQVQQPWAAGACAGAPAGPSSFGPYAFVPGIPRVASRQFSLGTHVDWGSTQDSCYTGSPRSMMQRMGLSTSGSLARHLMPWTSTGSGTLSAAASFSATGQGPASVVAAAMSAAAAAAASHSPRGATAVTVPAGGSMGQQHGGMGERSSSWVNSAVGGVQAGSHPAQHLTHQSYGQGHGQAQATAPLSDTGGGSSSNRPADARHSRSSSGGGSSSSNVAAATGDMSKLHMQQPWQHAQQQHGHHQQQQQARALGLPPAGPTSSSHVGVPANANANAAAQAAAAAAAAAAAGSQITPLALAVAAAVAEHNKRQPRRWTPFALRVHQLRVAQVLLAERQKQVAAQQQQPGLTQQLQQAQAAQQEGEAHAPANQQPAAAAPRPAGAAAAAAAAAPTCASGRQAGSSRAAGPVASAQASASSSRRAHAASTIQQQQQQQEETAMAQRLPAAAAPPTTEGGKGQKSSKKKWLACFVPRAFS